jgi:uncharacterized protein
MRQRTFIFFLISFAFFFFAAAPGAHAAIAVPALKGRINDYAGMLSPQASAKIEAELKSLEQTDSTQIVILTVPSLDGEPMESFSMRVAEAWKIGMKSTDNGAILVIAKNDRKMRIEVGYGLEGRLTDLVSGQIIRNVIVPEFKTGNFDAGIINGVQAMISAVKGEYKAPAGRRQTSRGNNSAALFPVLFIAFIALGQVGRTNRIFGALAGAVLLPVIAATVFSAGLFLIVVLIPIGFVAGILLAILFPFSGGGFPPGGGYWGGGGFSGGGGGGGFGGFSGGGGGFGGGGASGGW